MLLEFSLAYNHAFALQSIIIIFLVFSAYLLHCTLLKLFIFFIFLFRHAFTFCFFQSPCFIYSSFLASFVVLFIFLILYYLYILYFTFSCQFFFSLFYILHLSQTFLLHMYEHAQRKYNNVLKHIMFYNN